MRFACFNAVAPGATFAEQCEAVARAGCVGVETIVFPNTPLSCWQRETRDATRYAGIALAAVILGGLALHEDDQLGYVREAMHAVSELGAAVLLTPEYAPQDPLPLLPPHRGAPLHEQARVDEAMRAIGACADELNMQVLVEPITPFESRFCRSAADALALCNAAKSVNVQVALDTHNMNITEAKIGDSIRATGARLGHVHLADNNRLLPGCGHIDFGEVMTALRNVGYDGWLSFECAVLGDFEVEVFQTIHWLRKCALPPHPGPLPQGEREQ
jgi:sugar phosphate isomerase/epimerase